MDFKVLTLNTHKGFSAFNRKFTLPSLRKAIRHTSADLIFLQEVVGQNDKFKGLSKKGPSTAHHEFLAEDIWPDFAYGKCAVYSDGHHGNAILSKFPIEESVHLDISTHRLESRGFLYCRIKLPKTSVFLHSICVHLGLIGHHRLSQYKKLSNYIEKNISPKEPLIVAGDFNDWSERALKSFAEPLHLKDAFHLTKKRSPRSFPVAFPLLRLDRIYLRHLKALKTDLLWQDSWSKISDHAALIAEVSLES